MPVGDRRSAVARRRAVRGMRREGSLTGWGFGRRGPAGRCADRRSAFQAVPALFRDWRAALRAAVPGSTGRTARRSGFQGVLALVLGLWCAALTLAGWSVIGAGFAFPRDAGRRPALQPSRACSRCGARHSRWREGTSSARVSRSRAMPVGDRRSSRPRACSPSVVRGTHAGGMERHRRGFRASARCRSERRSTWRSWAGESVIGAGFHAGRRPASSRARACSRSVVRGTHAGRMERHRRGFRAPAMRCRSETGAPARVSRSCRSRLFSVCGARHSRWWDGASSARVSRFRAMPVGDRRSWPCPRLFSVCGARHSRWRDGALSVLVSRSRAMPVGDRRSSRPGACSRSVVRGTHGGGRERHRRGFRASARCRSETGAPGGARHSRWREGASSELVSRFRAMPV